MSVLRDKGAILKECIALNSLSYNDLISICGQPESTVIEWIHGPLIIDDASLLYIYSALHTAKSNIPRELLRWRSSLFSKCRTWAGKNSHKDREKPVYVGDKKRDTKRVEPFKYVFNNKLLSRVEIAEKTGLKAAAIYNKIRFMDQGCDVTKIVSSIRHRAGRPRKL